MNKTELVAAVAEKTGVSKADAERVVNQVMADIKEAVAAGEKVQLIGFGSFGVQERAERKVVHPVTGKKVKVAAHKAPVFRPGMEFKKAVNVKKRGRKKKA